MKPRNGFILSIFFLVLTASVSYAQSNNCRKMDVTVDVTGSQNGQGGSIRVTSSDSGLKFSLHLLGMGAKSNTDQLHIKNGTIKNIPPGEYDLIIQDTKGGYCSETRKVTVTGV
jgi:hypothetical protein